MTRKSLYLTTPIYYVNDVPHVGHAYTTIAADVVTRARRLGGRDAFFQTGTDEHGQNIERIARERGITPQQQCDEISARFRSLWERLDVRYDDFIRTTEPRHKRGALRLWARLRTARVPDGREAVYTGTYAGWYCPRCEGFKDEEELKQPGNLCPDHERPCEWTEEENFFFRLSAYAAWLQAEIEAGRIRIDPPGRRNEVLSFIRGGLQDFSISRARVKWGIPVPEQPDHVLYVWVDALANYITALGFGEDDPAKRQRYEHWWAGTDAPPDASPERMHLIGKDIIRFHCLYWPAVLKAAGVPVPTRFFAQGWITRNGKKLSKTTGNVIDPEALVDQWGPDAVRYFLLREGSFGQDWDFTDTAFVGRYNADLANDLGNLVSRALTMVERYCSGKVPARPEQRDPVAGWIENELQEPDNLTRLTGAIFSSFEDLAFAEALAEIWHTVALLNSSIVARSPWTLAKDPALKGSLDAYLYRLLEAVRLTAVFVSPVMPRAAIRVYRMLGLSGEPGTRDLDWGRLEPGSALGTIEPLFPRVEKSGRESDGGKKDLNKPGEKDLDKKEIALNDETPARGVPPLAPPSAGPSPGTAATSPSSAAVPGVIDISDFAKVELRAAVITQAEKIAGSKKLIKLLVDLGSETRQVVAGIAESYAPEALVGKRIVLVANLKPAKLMGVESNGMVLAGSVDGKAILCTFDAEVAPGTKVK